MAPEESISDPGPAELEWIAGHLAAGERLAATLLPDRPRPLSVPDLDRLWAVWLESDPDPATANDVVHAVGLSFGQRLVDDLGMRWRVISDQWGTEMAVHHATNDARVFPANLVAKRWESKQTGFLVAVRDGTAQLIGVRPADGPRRRGLFRRR